MAVNLDMTRLTDWNSDFLTVIFPILVWGIISRLAGPGPSQCRLIYHDSNVVRVPWSFEKHTYQSDEHFENWKISQSWQDFEWREFLVQVKLDWSHSGRGHVWLSKGGIIILLSCQCCFYLIINTINLGTSGWDGKWTEHFIPSCWIFYSPDEFYKDCVIFQIVNFWHIINMMMEDQTIAYTCKSHTGISQYIKAWTHRTSIRPRIISISSILSMGQQVTTRVGQ